MAWVTRAGAILTALAAVAALATAARAADPYMTGNDYTVTYPTGQYVAPPAGAAQLLLQPDTNNGKARFALPFRFDYFGWSFDAFWASANGHGAFTNRENGPNSNATNQELPFGSSIAGIVAPLWDDLSLGASGKIVWWTDGTAPNRRVVVSWEGLGRGDSTPVGVLTFQVHLHETSNRIVFAYKPDAPMTTWLLLSYTAGLSPCSDGCWTAPFSGIAADQRYCDAFNHLTNNAGHPPSDVQFDLTTKMHITGRVVFDRVVSDATGLGNSVALGVPAKGARVYATQPADGAEVASAYCDATGAFDVAFTGRPVQMPIVYVGAESPAVAVKLYAGGDVLRQGLAAGAYVWKDTDIGTLAITQASDADGTLRSALAIVASVQDAYDVLSALPQSLPAQMDAYHDVTRMGDTLYSARIGATPDSMRIGSVASGNEDAWDAAVVVKTYARHVLASVAAATPTHDAAYDAVTDEGNAFAEGFGYALYAAGAHTSKAYDGVGPGQTTVIDLENPSALTRKGPDVAAWVAAALYDLVDAANEPHDRVDGTGGEDRVYRAVEALTSVPNADSFLGQWIALGFGGADASRDFIAHGICPDDPGEPNDSLLEAATIGPAPFLSAGRTLTRGNEDWFAVTLLATVPALRVEVGWNRVGQPAQVTLQLVELAGTVIATGVPQGTSGPVLLTASSVPAGSYLLRVRHDAGATMSPYGVQVFEPLAMTRPLPEGWTIGRPMSLSIGAAGGVPGLTLSTDPPGTQPDGLYFGVEGDRLLGTPAEAKSYQFTLRLEDSGSPVHRVLTSVTFAIHPPLLLDVAPFLGFPVGRTSSVARLEPGGTAPRVFDVAAGALPPGLVLDAAAFRLHGSADAPGSTALTLRGVDVAGSESSQAVTIVGAAALASGRAEVDLAAGGAACGVWFDALAGSPVSFAAGTAKGRAKRALTPWLIGPDGRSVAGAKLSGGAGKSKGSVALCPASGRYFAIFASDAGEATRLTASVVVGLPKGGKGTQATLDFDHPVLIEVGALAGATLDLTLKPDRKSGLVAAVQSLVDPDGNPVAFAGFVTEKKGVLRLVAPLPVAGTWTVRVGAKPQTAGAAAWSYKVKQPKGVAYAWTEE